MFRSRIPRPFYAWMRFYAIMGQKNCKTSNVISMQPISKNETDFTGMFIQQSKDYKL